MFGLRLSRVKKPVSSQVGAEDFPSKFASIATVLDEHEGNIQELMTAINRIERKQNRWLDLLNLKSSDLNKAGPSEEHPPGAGLVYSGGDGGVQPPEPMAGEPTEL